ncbi:TetR-like C-terminal domain-containing protein [Tsukamurella soli]|uniref:TetR-like C-terminal domain-containing protein n=1 Tax=Tsukamurella soli TaxID=644556 RepID=UPI0036098612
MRESRQTRFTAPDTGSLRGDIVAALTEVAELLSAPVGRYLAAAAISGENPEIDSLTREFAADRTGREQILLDRARDRGELTEQVDARSVFDPAIGALWLRILLLREEATSGAIAALTDRIILGLPRTEPARRD